MTEAMSDSDILSDDTGCSAQLLSGIKLLIFFASSWGTDVGTTVSSLNVAAFVNHS